MKLRKRSLMSLVLAFVMIFSMIPAAMATWNDGFQEELTVSPGDTFTLSAGYNGGLMEVEKVVWSSSNSNYIRVDSDDGTVTVSPLAADGMSATIYADVYYYGYESVPSDLRSEFVQLWYWTITVEDDDSIDSTYGDVVSLEPSTLTLAPGESDIIYIDVAPGYTAEDIDWYRDSSNPYVTIVDHGLYATVTVAEYVPAAFATANITVTMDIYDDDDYWYDYPDYVALTSRVVVEGARSQLYITDDKMEINVDEYDVLSVSSYSSALDAYLDDVVWYSSNPSIVTVENYYNYSSSNNYAYGSSIYVNAIKTGKATVYAELTVGVTEYVASCEVTVVGKEIVDVFYTIGVGESLYLDTESFEDFWSDNVSATGSLDYVVFGSGSGNVGKLAYYKNSSNANASLGSIRFYADPTSAQYGIEDIFFYGNARYTTGTLTVPFTAYGTNTSYNTTNTSQEGTLYISVIYDDVDDIKYEMTSTYVDLASSDFISVYKDSVSNPGTNPAVYIQFLDTPRFGDLYLNYSNSSYYSNGTLLTNKDIAGTRFSSRTTGNYRIDNVTYVSNVSSVSDTIRYAAYSSAAGKTMLYIGEITFYSGETPVIKYYTNPGKAITFSANDFNISELGYASYMKFSMPSSGTFYKNYGTTSAAAVTSYDTFTVGSTTSNYMTSLNALTYVPNSSYTGVIDVPFTASNLLGGDAKGTLRIYVAAPFSDVTANYSWATDYITRLAAQGIVHGDDAVKNTFAPGANLKYGEALKLIMEATGYPTPVKTSSHWASGYLTQAFINGIVSSTSIDLNAPISRDAVAELAAKALKMSPAYSIKAGIVGPTDSNNAYVYALYNAGILNGDNSTGVNRYNGANSITRAEICKIVCLVNDYYTSH